MALEIALKSQERIVLAGAVVRNTGRHTAHLMVETPATVLRQRDILPQKDATTPCTRIYLAIQLMYLEPESVESLQQMYLDLATQVVEAAPSLRPVLEQVSVHVACGDHYRALQASKTLIEREKELLKSALEPRNDAKNSSPAVDEARTPSVQTA